MLSGCFQTSNSRKMIFSVVADYEMISRGLRLVLALISVLFSCGHTRRPCLTVRGQAGGTVYARVIWSLCQL